jgi:acetyltransferase-like isoleucine patch superfamily enzyme
MKNFIYQILYFLQFDRIVEYIFKAATQVRLLRYKNAGVAINFVSQGGHEIVIAGDISKFEIHPTSHLKSDTFIECSGGVRIGKYFHVGRGLTIYSTNHNYSEGKRIPYDDVEIRAPVVIGDFVWCGANVTIVPGITIGEGVVIGAGSVVTRDVSPMAVIGGNPAQVIKYRDVEHFEELKAHGAFH